MPTEQPLNPSVVHPSRRDVRYVGSVAGVTVLVLAVAVVVLGSLTRERQGAAGGEAPGIDSLPPDIDRLGLMLAPVAGTVLIGQEPAVSAAWDVAANLKDQSPEVNAYLVSATDPAWVNPGEFTARPIWIVRFSGLALEFPGAPNAEGSPGSVNVAHFAYVYIDAVTGEAIDFQYWE